MTKPVHPDFASDEYVRRWLADPALAGAPTTREQCHEPQADRRADRNGLEAYTCRRQPLPDVAACQEPEPEPDSLGPRRRQSRQDGVGHHSPCRRKLTPDKETRQDHHGASHEPDPSLEYARRPRRRTRLEKYEYRGDEQEKRRARKKPATMCRSWRNKSGDALNRDFKAPNVESKRLTLGYRTTPGFLAKGRASAPMPRRGSPGLAFSEMAFLSKGQEELDGAEGRFKAVAPSVSNHQDSLRSDDSVHHHPVAPTRSTLPPFQAYKPASRPSSYLCRPPSAEKGDKDSQACEKKHARIEDFGRAAHRVDRYYSLEDLKELAAAERRSETAKPDLQLPMDLTVPFMTGFRDGVNHDSRCDDQLGYKVHDCAAAPVSDLARVQTMDHDYRFQDVCRATADEPGSGLDGQYSSDLHGQYSSGLQGQYKLIDSGQALSVFSLPWQDQQHEQPMDAPDLDLNERLSDDDVHPHHLEYMALCPDSESANHQMLKASSPGFDAFDSALLASLSRQQSFTGSFNNKRDIETRVPTSHEMPQDHVVFSRSSQCSRPRLMRPSEETDDCPEPFTCLLRSHILY